MYLSRLISYARQNNITVYDDSPALQTQHVTATNYKRKEIFLAAGQSRDARAVYLAKALHILTGRQVPDLLPKDCSNCHCDHKPSSVTLGAEVHDV